MSKYIVYIKTGNKDSAGTNSKVYIQLTGSLKTSAAFQLQSSRTDLFERDVLDVFVINSVNLGTLKTVRLYHDNSGLNSGWYVSHVEVMDCKANQAYHAGFARWLATDEGDGAIDVTKALNPQPWHRHNWIGTLYKYFSKPDKSNSFGDVPLCQLPIPGTHDSGTYGMSNLAETQRMSVQQQLLLGIRFFDLRPKVNDNVFYIHHGSTKLSEGSKNNIAKCTADFDPKHPETSIIDLNYPCIFKDIRDFLTENPNEVIILKFQSFEAHTTQYFNPKDHVNFRALMNQYLPLISPRSVHDLTLNNIYKETGRVIVFYGDDLSTHDSTWANIWPYQPGTEQKNNGVNFGIYDPYYPDDLGDAGADDDEPSFSSRWVPYLTQNLRDWQARDLAQFFVTQAQMQPRPGDALQSAKDNNQKNIDQFTAWMKTGVPKARGVLRPNILTLDYIEYGNLSDEIVAYFLSLDKSGFAALYPYHDFDIAPVYLYAKTSQSEFTFLSALPERLSTRIDNLSAPWKSTGRMADFRVHSALTPNTVAVYEVGPENDSDYQYKYYREDAMPSDTELAAMGWEKLRVAFYAYPTQQPGTKPVHEEFNLGQNAGDDRKLNYSLRSASEAGAHNYAQQRLAFYAYEYKTDLVPMYVYEEIKRQGYYRLSSSIKVDYTDGWERAGADFQAHRGQALAAHPIYEEKNSSGVYRYTSNQATDSQWDREGVAFHAYKTQIAGTVPVYQETPASNPHSRYYYSPRSATEATKYGWKQLGVAFYAFPYAVK